MTDEQRRAYAEAKARAEANYPDAMTVMLLGEPLPVEVTAVAEVLGLDPDALDWHVEAVHGREPHDEGYEDYVWSAAQCTDPEHLMAPARWGSRETAERRAPVPASRRQVRVQRRRERKRGR